MSRRSLFKVLDSDASSFITIAGITDTTQQSAVNTLVVDLKSNNLWSKTKAIYPFVGGSSFSHKWNLKDPRDLDEAFRLVFSGTWLHNSNGITPTAAFADTKINPALHCSINDVALSIYSRTNTDGTQIDIGTFSAPYGLYLMYKYSGGLYRCLNALQASIGTYTGNTLGCLIGSRRVVNEEVYFKNGVLFGKNSIVSTILINSSIKIGSVNGQHSTKNIAFAHVGNGLTDSECIIFSTIVQKFQTTLNRQV